jgi:hypothetical protein
MPVSRTKLTGLKWIHFYQPLHPSWDICNEKNKVFGYSNPVSWQVVKVAGSSNWTDCSELKEEKDTNKHSWSIFKI